MANPERPLLLPEDDQLEYALALYKRGLFGINVNSTIPLKSGRLSPHYLDMRPGISNHEFRNSTAQMLMELTVRNLDKDDNLGRGLTYDHIAGTPEAMTSYVATMADLSEMSLLQPRANPDKASGNKSPILGRYYPGDSVAAYDDVVTDGAEKIANVELLEDEELDVDDYYVVLDREEGGAPFVEDRTGIVIVPALGLSTMVRMLKEERFISLKEFDAVARYMDKYGEPHAKDVMETA